MLVDVELADLLAHQRFHDADAALPAVTLLGGTGQLAAVEIEIRLADLFGQNSSAGQQNVPGGPQLPVGQPVVGQQPQQVLDVARHHVHQAMLRQFAAAQQSLDQLWKLVEIRRVVGFQSITAGHDIPVAGSDLGFQGDDALCGDLGIQPEQLRGINKPQHLCDVLAVGSQRIRVGFAAIVGLIRQTKPGLHQVGHRIFTARVFFYPECQRAAHTNAFQRAQVFDEFSNIADGKLGEVVGKRFQPGGINALGVHEGSKQVAGAAGVLIDDLSDVIFGLITQFVKGAIHGAIIRDHMVFQPRAVDIGI